MTKTLTNFAFITACFMVTVIFVTSKTFPQLAIAVLLYPMLIFLGFMVFPRKQARQQKFTQPQQPQPAVVQNSANANSQPTTVADIDKRTFIKLIGATSISFFLFSIFGRGVEQLIFGNSRLANNNNTGDPFGSSANPTDGFKVSEIDEGEISYYGFTNKNGAWLIMQEGSDAGSFRYAKGSQDFSGNWDNRGRLIYDYYHNLTDN